MESVYEKALALRLKEQGLKVEAQSAINVYFHEKIIGHFKADLLIENSVILELKAVQNVVKKHEVQLVNYLKATEIEVGLLINFGEDIKIIRKVLDNERKAALGEYRSSWK